VSEPWSCWIREILCKSRWWFYECLLVQ